MTLAIFHLQWSSNCNYLNSHSGSMGFSMCHPIFPNWMPWVRRFFFGRCFFGRNNLGEYPDENFGVNCQRHGHEEARISDGILGRVFNNDRADYSFAMVYAEDETSAQVEIFLNPNIFEKIYMAKNTANFHLVTSFYEHKKITEEQFKGKDREPDNIIVKGEPGAISSTDKFSLDIGIKDFGMWWFRVRLVSLDFPPAESSPAL